jgi:hypothetical protein
VYFAIGTCNHNMICWTCILKQRMKSDIMDCPVCKEKSMFVLITDDPSETIESVKKSGKAIIDNATGLVFASHAVKSFVMNKIGNTCHLCPQGDKIF